jgi:hypothetical protein
MRTKRIEMCGPAIHTQTFFDRRSQIRHEDLCTDSWNRSSEDIHLLIGLGQIFNRTLYASAS